MKSVVAGLIVLVVLAVAVTAFNDNLYGSKPLDDGQPRWVQPGQPEWVESGQPGWGDPGMQNVAPVGVPQFYGPEDNPGWFDPAFYPGDGMQQPFDPNNPAYSGGMPYPCGWQPPSDCDGFDPGSFPDGQYPGAEVPPEVPYMPVCELSVCVDNCKRHFGFEEGSCINNECYCRQNENEGKPGEPAPKPVEPEQQWRWHHENQEEWGSHYPQCNKSTARQSPINILDEHVRDLTKKIFLENYETDIGFILENNGHAAEYLVQSATLPTLRLAVDILGDSGTVIAKKGSYALTSVEVHWGSSEHAFLGQKENVELQLHHIDLTKDTFEETVDNGGNIVTVALLFKVEEDSDLRDSFFAPIDSVLSPDPNSIGATVEPQPYFDFLVEEPKTTFGVYAGSLTSPPCAKVAWFVSDQIYSISSTQVEKLQQLRDEKGELILSNTRKLQD